jgi:hypothetical protein
MRSEAKCCIPFPFLGGTYSKAYANVRTDRKISEIGWLMSCPGNFPACDMVERPDERCFGWPVFTMAVVSYQRAGQIAKKIIFPFLF